jgi:GNAT superfamily N-acetyltransferase
MQVKCFACPALVRGEGTDAVIQAFVAHGQEQHSWSYPEEAIKTYARNYGEATERLSDATERLAEIGEITIHRVTAERVDDWLRFFDYDGFAGNPDWASCYCLEPHVPAPPEQPERPWRDARAAVADRLGCGATFGYLAYVGERVVGWVNASLRSTYGLFQGVDPDGPDPGSVIGVSCYVISPPFRRHGVATALLDRVLADAPGRGASWIEAYPRNQPAPDDASHFRGPRSLYDGRGFRPVVVRERDTVVRRPV